MAGKVRGRDFCPFFWKLRDTKTVGRSFTPQPRQELSVIWGGRPYRRRNATPWRAQAGWRPKIDLKNGFRVMNDSDKERYPHDSSASLRTELLSTNDLPSLRRQRFERGPVFDTRLASNTFLPIRPAIALKRAIRLTCFLRELPASPTS